MAANNAQAQGGAQQGQQQQQGGISWTRLLMMGFLFYTLFLRAPNKAPVAPVAPVDPSKPNVVLPAANVFTPLYPAGAVFDFYVFMGEQKEIQWSDNPQLLWNEKGIVYGNWDDNSNRVKDLTFPTTPGMRNNGTVFAHIIFTLPGRSPNPGDKNYEKPLFSRAHQLNKYIKKDLAKFAKKNLISGDVDKAWLEREKWQAERKSQGIVDTSNMKVLSHWKTNLTINLITEFSKFKSSDLPPVLSKHMNFTEQGEYYPIIFPNDFWLLNEDLNPINDTVSEVNLHMEFSPLSFFRFTLYAQMDESFSMQKDWFGAEEGESEEFKRLLIDNNPYVLLATFIISMVHMVLDTLAFKNDIQFWREKKSMEGMSVRTLYINVISNLIIFLYLLDNDTSLMVMFSVGVGLAIEVWKVTRAARVTIAYYGSIPYPVFTDKEDYVQSHTKDHDLAAMKYLYYASFPMVGGYAVYSLMYETHRSWYSFIVGTLAGVVYTFGFIMMTPQLFINYKLKSVAHLPWRVFIYKAMSTFIDDIFAFLIRMPTMHRLRVFRDDIIFLIYLYQRWIYPVDKKRIEVGADFADVSVDEINAAKAEAEAREAAKKGETAPVQGQAASSTVAADSAAKGDAAKKND